MNVVKLTLNHLCVATTFMHSLIPTHRTCRSSLKQKIANQVPVG